MLTPKLGKLPAKATAEAAKVLPNSHAHLDGGVRSPVELALMPRGTIGNQAMLQLLVRRGLSQPACATRGATTVGRANDPLEHEADRAAVAVLAGRPVFQDGALLAKQQETITPETKAPEQSGHDGHRALPRPLAAAVSQAGVPLAAHLRSYFEPRFGHDFSRVRIHTDMRADMAARSISARAFTFGRHIAFASGEYAPGMSEGRRVLAHELAHVVQQSSGATQVQRTPGKSDAERLADYIDRHPAWGTWIGGSGSVEGYQELEVNAPGREAAFYRSAEFRAWYMSGWRGLQGFADPTKALQFVAAVLITDEAARNKLFSDIRIGGPGGQVGKVAGSLDQARKTGTVEQAVAVIEEISAARKTENIAGFDLAQYDAMAKDRKLWSGMGVTTFERWTLAGAEVSVEEVSKTVNREIEQKRQIPQIDKDFKWFAVDTVAGERKVHSTHLAKEGKIPNKAQGGVSIRYYKLSDGRIITREFWHRAEPGKEERGTRMLRVIWSTHMGPDRLAQYEGMSLHSSMQGYGAWGAGRMPPGGGVGTGAKPVVTSAKPAKTEKPASTPAAASPARIPVPEFNPRIAVFDKNGNLIAHRNAVAMSHQGMLDQNRALNGKLPEGGRAVTIFKEGGKLHVHDSVGLHGRAGPSPQWVQDAANKHFQ